METDAGALDQLEESKKRLQRELEEKILQLEERTAHMDKVCHASENITITEL